MKAAIEASAQKLRACGPVPEVALLLGSGWGGVLERVQGGTDLDYGELPAFPRPGVGGHAGRLRIGLLGGSRVVVLAGRRHAYEDGRADAMKGAIRSLAVAGVTSLVQTNAAGSLDATLPPGSLMLVEDHLNIAQFAPLTGEEGDARFVDMGAAYDPALRARALAAARSRGIALAGGVYAGVIGPQFETPAEIRWLRSAGARSVGMSTVAETILARHAGLRVLAISMITNLAAGMSTEPLSHAHTLAAAQAAGARAADLIEAIFAVWETP